MIELNDGDFVVLKGIKYKVNDSELLPIGRLVGPHGGEMTTLGEAAKKSKCGPVVGVINVYLNWDHLLLKDGYFDLVFDCNGQCVDYRVDANIPIEINIPQQAKQEQDIKSLRELDLKQNDIVSIDFLIVDLPTEQGGDYLLQSVTDDRNLWSKEHCQARLIKRSADDIKQ